MRFWPWTPRRIPAPASADSAEYARYDAYTKLLDRNGRWIEVADAKAGAVLVFLTAAFPGLTDAALTAMPRLFHAIPSKSHVADFVPLGVLLVLTAAFAVLSLITLSYVLKTLLPRTSRAQKTGHIFFVDAAACAYDDWTRDLLALDVPALTAEVVEQVHATACIAAIKHKYVQLAVRWVFWAVVAGLAVFVASHVFS